MEESFGIIESLLSLFSNTLSFIRVGAFAITHVGLFLAFLTISNMINSPVASTLIIILANIVIIGLEGLIVFIQGLRLEYIMNYLANITTAVVMNTNRSK